MTFTEYQKTIEQFDVSNGELWYYVLGMAGEVGEFAEKVKKHYRDGTTLNATDLKFELGDVLWYLGRAAAKCGIDLDAVAQGNVEKLTARSRTGTLHGSGDYRHRATASIVGESLGRASA